MTPSQQSVESRRATEARAALTLKLVIFLIAAVILGLLNIFVMWFVGLLDGMTFNMDKLLEDGSLFFYAITLLGGSVYATQAANEDDFQFKFIKAISLTIFAIVLIVAVAATTTNDIKYFESNPPSYDKHPQPLMWVELIIAFVSILCAFGVTYVLENRAARSVPPDAGSNGIKSMPHGP